MPMLPTCKEYCGKRWGWLEVLRSPMISANDMAMSPRPARRATSFVNRQVKVIFCVLARSVWLPRDFWAEPTADSSSTLRPTASDLRVTSPLWQESKIYTTSVFDSDSPFWSWCWYSSSKVLWYSFRRLEAVSKKKQIIVVVEPRMSGVVSNNQVALIVCVYLFDQGS